MTAVADFHYRVQKVFEPNGRGVVALVDELLTLSGERALRLDCHDEECRIRTLDVQPEESIELPLQNSVFRALLARVAALCNERMADSVSPYGGEGEIALGSNPPTILRVAFVNRPGEQRLEVRRIA